MLVLTVIAAFAVGGISMIFHVWWLFWVCATVVALCVPAGLIVRIMDDTMAWTHAVPRRYEDKFVTVEATRRQRRQRRTG